MQPKTSEGLEVLAAVVVTAGLVAGNLVLFSPLRVDNRVPACSGIASRGTPLTLEQPCSRLEQVSQSSALQQTSTPGRKGQVLGPGFGIDGINASGLDQHVALAIHMVKEIHFLGLCRGVGMPK